MGRWWRSGYSRVSLQPKEEVFINNILQEFNLLHVRTRSTLTFLKLWDSEILFSVETKEAEK